MHNDELNAVVLGHEFAAQMLAMFNADLQASDAVDIAQWGRRSLVARFKEWAARIWQYWL